MPATSDPASIVIFLTAVGLLVAVVVVLATFLEMGPEATKFVLREAKEEAIGKMVASRAQRKALNRQASASTRVILARWTY
jgi:hypothetical protein